MKRLNTDAPILVIQTAFPGDVILTTPLLEALHKQLPSTPVDIVVTPVSAPLLDGHPAVREVIRYDKRGADRGVSGYRRLVGALRGRTYGTALVPHRSLRSAFLAWRAGIPTRVGFDRSAGRRLMSIKVRYDPDAHEIERNLSLASALSIAVDGIRTPTLFPSAGETRRAEEMVQSVREDDPPGVVAIAPGSIWATKRWLPASFAMLVRQLAERGYPSILVGGEADRELCEEIRARSGTGRCTVVAGEFSLLASAALIRRCAVLVTNDSAPMHLAAAMHTPVIAIFGATIPAFGFAPRGKSDVTVEVGGLPCRPCGIHGGRKCPLGTFDCMKEIRVERVLEAVLQTMGG